MPKATSILAVRYIGYTSAICMCFVVAFLSQGQRIHTEHPVIFWLTMLGFAINLSSVAMVAMLMFRPKLARGIGVWCIRQLTRIPALRHKHDQWQQNYDRGMHEFAAAANCIREHPWQCAVGVLLSLASVVSQFSVAYFVYRGVGLTEAGYFELFSMQIYLFLAVAFAPTPGATGATEGGFYLFFALLFPQTLLFSAMLLWRLFTYYSNLLLGAGLVVADELHAMRRVPAPEDDAVQ